MGKKKKDNAWVSVDHKEATNTVTPESESVKTSDQDYVGVTHSRFKRVLSSIPWVLLMVITPIVFYQLLPYFLILLAVMVDPNVTDAMNAFHLMVWFMLAASFVTVATMLFVKVMRYFYRRAIKI